MRRAAVHIRNLMANWVGYCAPLVVALLLTPFIIGRLGAERYGVLTLMLSVSGYLGLADMGIGVSIGRYVNLYMARREGDKVNHVINSAIPFFVLAGLVLVARPPCCPCTSAGFSPQSRRLTCGRPSSC